MNGVLRACALPAEVYKQGQRPGGDHMTGEGGVAGSAFPGAASAQRLPRGRGWGGGQWKRVRRGTGLPGGRLPPWPGGVT